METFKYYADDIEQLKEDILKPITAHHDQLQFIRQYQVTTVPTDHYLQTVDTNQVLATEIPYEESKALSEMYEIKTGGCIEILIGEELESMTEAKPDPAQGIVKLIGCNPDCKIYQEISRDLSLLNLRYG